MKNKTSIITNNEYVIVDIETTGFSVEQCCIIQIAAIKVSEGEIIDTYNTFIKQTDSIPYFITHLTGITDNDVAFGINIEDAMKEFLEFIGDLTLVGHNISFDYRFLNNNAFNYIGISLSNYTVDTMKLAKDLISDVSNYKLNTLCDYFHIKTDGHHRADNDILMTYELIKALSVLNEDYRGTYSKEINHSIANGDFLRGKKIAIKTQLKNINIRYLECVLGDLNCRIWDSLYPSTQILIVGDRDYEAIVNNEEFDELFNGWKIRAKEWLSRGKLSLYSESQIIELLEIPTVKKKNNSFRSNVKAKDIVAETVDFDETHPLYLKNCVFTGILDRYDRKVAMQYVANVGGKCQDVIRKDTDYLILGDNSFCAFIKDGKSSKLKKAEEMILNGSSIQIIPETTFYQLLKNE